MVSDFGYDLTASSSPRAEMEMVPRYSLAEDQERSMVSGYGFGLVQASRSSIAEDRTKFNSISCSRSAPVSTTEFGLHLAPASRSDLAEDRIEFNDLLQLLVDQVQEMLELQKQMLEQQRFINSVTRKAPVALHLDNQNTYPKGFGGRSCIPSQFDSVPPRRAPQQQWNTQYHPPQLAGQSQFQFETSQPRDTSTQQWTGHHTSCSPQLTSPTDEIDGVSPSPAHSIQDPEEEPGESIEKLLQDDSTAREEPTEKVATEVVAAEVSSQLQYSTTSQGFFRLCNQKDEPLDTICINKNFDLDMPLVFRMTTTSLNFGLISLPQSLSCWFMVAVVRLVSMGLHHTFTSALCALLHFKNIAALTVALGVVCAHNYVGAADLELCQVQSAQYFGGGCSHFFA